MTNAEVVQEVLNRGFHYMDDGGTEEARVQRWVNDSYHEICEEADWPFLEATAAGAATLALTRCRRVIDVAHTTDNRSLAYATRAQIREMYGVTPESGTPTYWYPSTSATDTYTINVAPVSTDSVSVLFVQYAATLTGSDALVIPARYHWVVVEGAVRRAYADSDQYEQAAACEAFRQSGLKQMKESLLAPSLDSTYIIATDPYGYWS
jgi:hypothetical protein